MPQNPPGFYDYKGVTHAHSNLGVGSGSPHDIIEAAVQADLDFIFITDLNLIIRDYSFEGYHGQTMALAGVDYSYLDSRLLLYDSLGHHQVESLGQAQVLLTDLLSQTNRDTNKDLVVLAHPFKSGYKWSGPYPEALDGLEVINLKSVWQQAWLSRRISFLWSILIYPFNADLAFLRLYSEPKAEIELWNQLAAKHRTSGFAGNEATARTGAAYGNLYLKFPSYQVSFSLLSNHVLLRSELTGDFDKDKRKIIDALDQGQFYMALDLLGNPKGFSFYLQDGEKIEAMGFETKMHKGMSLVMHLPSKPKVPFEMYLLKDGERVSSSNQTESIYEIKSPGVYRAVVRVIPTMPLPDGRRWIPWIYSNPIYVR